MSLPMTTLKTACPQTWLVKPIETLAVIERTANRRLHVVLLKGGYGHFVAFTEYRLHGEEWKPQLGAPATVRDTELVQVAAALTRAASRR